MSTLKYDAEDYYRGKVEETCRKIGVERRKVSLGNSGFAFVSFQSNLQVKKCLLTGLFKRLIMENLSPEERFRSQILSWTILDAPSQSDIFWENLKK